MPSNILTAILSFIGGLCVTGSVGYLIVEHVLTKDKRREDVKKQKIANGKDVIGNGVSMLDLYKEMDSIVESKTKPLETKIDLLNERLDKFGCFRRNCAERVRNEEDIRAKEV